MEKKDRKEERQGDERKYRTYLELVLSNIEVASILDLLLVLLRVLGVRVVLSERIVLLGSARVVLTTHVLTCSIQTQ
jgi:arginine exporter protein ArgO